tara:strand:- start:1826 stop:2056 length:231 start_codon:yes stop_codon:yes gene_type:complete
MEFTNCDNSKCQEHIKFLHETISKMSVNNCNLEKDNIKLKEENEKLKEEIKNIVFCDKCGGEAYHHCECNSDDEHD